jgi:LuxR family maltose regulon positive regulatory protein
VVDSRPAAARGLVDTAFLPPRLPRELVRRPAVEARLGPDPGASWTLVVGPPGSGKSTLVRSWLDDRPGAWAWVGLDADSRARVDVAELLVRAVQIARPDLHLGALDELDMDGEDPVGVLRRLVEELAADLGEHGSTVVVLDDAHHLDRPAWDALGWLLGHLPPGLHLVVVSRRDPPLPLGRERAIGRLAEVRARDLEFDVDDTSRLLAAALGTPAPSAARELHDRTHGWVAGLRLAVLAVRSGADLDQLVARFGGTEATVAELLLEEVLDRLPDDECAVLRASSILAVVEPDLCDAVAGRGDSAGVLARLASEGVFVTPVEGETGRYRMHPMLAELLRYQQRATDPAAARAAHLAAADSYLGHGRSVDAIEHLIAAGEHDQAHRLVLDHFAELYVGRHRADLSRWLGSTPDAVVTASLDRAVRHTEALALLSAVGVGDWLAWCQDHVPEDHPARARLASMVALGHAVNARLDELRRARADARSRRAAGVDDPFDEIIASWEVRIEAVLGDPVRAVELGRELLGRPRELLSDPSALSNLALALDEAGDLDGAAAVAERSVARWRAEGEPELPGMVDALVTLARRERRAGDPGAAEDLVEMALALPPRRVVPHLLIALPLVERARLERAGGDGGWRARLVALAEELRMAGATPPLIAWVEGVSRELEGEPTPDRTAPARSGELPEELTDREREILRLLASHLTFPEIGEELFISRHTVKTHVSRVYRKLGVGGRSAAVREAQRLGLLRA